VIEKIEGRADDLLWGIRKSDRSRHFIYQDYISRTIICVSNDIEEFQVIQKDFDRLILRIKLKSLADRELIKQPLVDSIRKVFADYGCIEPEIDLIFGEPLPNINSGKLSRVICEIREI